MSRDVAILVGKRLLDFQLIQDTESNEDQDLGNQCYRNRYDIYNYCSYFT